MSRPRTRATAAPHPSELLPITDRARHLGALKLGLGSIVVAAVAIWPAMSTLSIVWLLIASAAYLCISACLLALVGRGRKIALPAVQAGLLLDGIYVAGMVGLTGGASSPLRFLLYIHIVGVTLLCSYRTGLKLALWDTVLFLWSVQAIEADLMPSPSPGAATSAAAAALTVAAMWFLALGTAALAAVNERELRRQKADLGGLSEMVARIDGGAAQGIGGREVPRILLEQICSTFGFARGVVLASRTGSLELLASTEAGQVGSTVEDPDPLMTSAWRDRALRMVREIDPTVDPRLADLLPAARNVMVIPLFVAGGHRLGLVAVERGTGTSAMRRWQVDMVQQFAAHAALALNNAWLTEDLEDRLRIIRSLDERLRAHNGELEIKVAERTEELRTVIRDLKEVDEQRRRLLHHVVRAAEDERRRISHDVHDDPVQKLVAVKMRLQMLASVHPELPEIMDAQATVASTMSSMRRMLFDLSPPVLDDEGIGPALRYFLENSSTSFRWTIDDDLHAQPSAETRVILYRTAQEALTNARKHSDAETVRVTLREREGGVWMEIEDDGVGFEPQEAVAAPGHLGLAAMRERAEMAGGSCTLRSLPGAGTCLEVWVPRQEEPAQDVIEVRDDGGAAANIALEHRIA